MKATTQSTISKSALMLGSAVAIAGLIAAAPAHAATSGSDPSGQPCNGQKMNQQKSGSSMDNGTSSQNAMKQPTNQHSGAAGNKMEPLSNQPGNQPKTAPKTQQ